MTDTTLPNRSRRRAAMTAQVGGLDLPNPILTAAGCGAGGRELAQFAGLSDLGAFTTESIMVQARAGRPSPRVVETPSGLLNAVGPAGPGIDAFLAADLPWLRSQGARVIVSIAGNSVAEYAELARRLDRDGGVSAVEVNPLAGPPGEVVRTVRAHTRREVPVFAKLSPAVADIVGVAMACADAGADALSMIGTVPGMAIDTATMRPVFTGVTGGLSGPAVRPVALRCVYQVHAAMPEVPIIGMGGVRTGLDALEFVLAGASAVAVGTALFHDPSVCGRVLRELGDALEERGIEHLADVIGLAHKPAGTSIRRIEEILP